MKRLYLAALTILAVAPLRAELSNVPPGAYELDNSHGYITFTYTHLGFSNPRVGFNAFDVSLDLDNDDPAESRVEVEIDATSIDSRVPVFNEHLNSADWFNTAEYPTISFRSTSIEATGESRYAVTGDLTIMGTTRPVTLDATINKAAEHPLREVPAIGISASADLLRSDWNLDGYVPAVSDEVKLSIEVELLKSDD